MAPPMAMTVPMLQLRDATHVLQSSSLQNTRRTAGGGTTSEADRWGLYRYARYAGHHFVCVIIVRSQNRRTPHGKASDEHELAVSGYRRQDASRTLTHSPARWYTVRPQHHSASLINFARPRRRHSARSKPGQNIDQANGFLTPSQTARARLRTPDISHTVRLVGTHGNNLQQMT